MRTSPNFDICLPVLLKNEGGFQNNPKDPGNWTGGHIARGELKGTKYGISAAQYPSLDIANLTPAQAGEIYWHDYWLPNMCEEMPLPIALLHFDASVMSSPRESLRWLQHAIGALVDGRWGPQTAAMVAQPRDDEQMVSVLDDMAAGRRAYLKGLPDAPEFYAGWEARVDRTLEQATALIGYRL